jgi:hypothetical protein
MTTRRRLLIREPAVGAHDIYAGCTFSARKQKNPIMIINDDFFSALKHNFAQTAVTIMTFYFPPL